MSTFLTPLVLVSASALAACADQGTPYLSPLDRGMVRGFGAPEASPPLRLGPPPAFYAPYQSTAAEARRRLDTMFQSWAVERQASASPSMIKPAEPEPTPPHSPPPDTQASGDASQQPPTIDATPPGSRCGWWRLCNLWE